MSPDTDPVPGWFADLSVMVARIDERTAAQAKQVDHVVSMVDRLQETTVPLAAHEYLMTTVRKLENQNVGAQSEWDEIIHQVPILWQERSEAIGGRAFRRTAVVALGAAVSLATLYNLLHGAGLVTLGPH